MNGGDYKNHIEYAKLGSSCNTSMRVLSSNEKYFPQNFSGYAQVYTKMYYYPLEKNQVNSCPNKKDFKPI